MLHHSETMALRRELGGLTTRQLNSALRRSAVEKGTPSLVRTEDSFQFFFPRGREGRYAGTDARFYVTVSKFTSLTTCPLTSRIRSRATRRTLNYDTGILIELSSASHHGRFPSSCRVTIFSSRTSSFLFGKSHKIKSLWWHRLWPPIFARPSKYR